MATTASPSVNERFVTAVVGIFAVVFLVAGLIGSAAKVLVVAGLLAGVALVGLTAGFRAWVPWWVLALLVLLSGFVVLGQLDGLLSGMHVFGGTRNGVSALGAKGGQPQAAFDVVRSWYRWYSQLPSVPDHYDSPAKVVMTYLAVDSFLVVPALAAVLGIPIVAAGLRLRKEANFQKVQRWLWCFPLSLLAVGVVSDWLENASYFFGFTSFARLHHHASSRAAHLLTGSHWFSVAKLVGYAVAALGLVIEWVVLRYLEKGAAEGQPRPLRDTHRVLGTTRAQIGLVLVLLVVLNAPQTADLILRWNVRQGIIAAFFAVTLALVVWAFARRLTLARTEHDHERLPFRRGAALALGLIAAALGGALWPVIHAWGIFVFAGFWILIWLLTVVFETLEEQPPKSIETRNEDVGGVVARVLASAVLVALALAIVRSTVGVAVVIRGPVSEARLAVIGFAMLAGSWLLYLGLRWHGLELREPVTTRDEVTGETTTVWELPKGYGVRRGPFLPMVVIAMVIGGYFWWRVEANPWAVGQFLGSVGLILLFLTVAAVVVGVLALWAEWVDPPLPIQAMGFRRFPVFIVLAGWFVIASVLPFDKGFHDVRFVEGSPSTANGRIVALQEAFAEWLSTIPAGELQARTSPNGTKRAIPLIIVSASGGAIRAGYWTDLVLDCIFSAEPMASDDQKKPCPGSPAGTKGNPFFFAVSSVSGSSVGAVEYVAHSQLLAAGVPDQDWVTNRVGGDYLSGELAWSLGIELPRVFFRFDAKMDRAEALERAWQQSWVSGPWTPGWVHALWNVSADQDSGPLTAGFLDTWQDRAIGAGASGAYVPLMVLNGSNSVDGCRVATSPLSSDGFTGPVVPNSAGQIPGCLNTPGDTRKSTATSNETTRILAATLDLDGVLCRATTTTAGRQDVQLSTAALLSARFPFVSPSGRIEQCGGAGRAEFVVDGGYLDASGGFTALELWRALAPIVEEHNLHPAVDDPAPGYCVVPFLVQIDNGYSEPKSQTATKRQEELTVPLKGAIASRSAVSELARQQAALAFAGPDLADGIVFNGPRYAHFYPRVHPGAQAPLNWVLSNTSKEDLFDQLSNNVNAINRVRGWLTSAQLRCP
jgi:hypothetical protein